MLWHKHRTQNFFCISSSCSSTRSKASCHVNSFCLVSQFLYEQASSSISSSESRKCCGRGHDVREDFSPAAVHPNRSANQPDETLPGPREVQPASRWAQTDFCQQKCRYLLRDASAPYLCPLPTKKDFRICILLSPHSSIFRRHLLLVTYAKKS